MKKVHELRALFEERAIDALLITNPYNRRYISGFTGTAGVVLITNDKALLITDFRYTHQAEEQAPHFKVIEHTVTIEEQIKTQLQELKINQLGFEGEDVSFEQYQLYKDTFQIKLVPVKNMVESIRMIKSTDELETLQTAAKIADDAFNHVLKKIKPNVREIDIAIELEFFMRKAGATSSSFDIIVASGTRSSLPHGIASTKRIKEGELVTLDFGALYNGYCSDITRTVAIGEISNKLEEIYSVVLEAQKRGVKGLKPGITGKEADDLTRQYIRDAGYGEYFGHSTGHGIGLEVHEGPSLSPRSQTTLEPGMVVTVEPGIYIPELGGCRIEDDIVITEEGNRRLTLSEKELIQLH